MFVIPENIKYAASLETTKKPVHMGAAMTERTRPGAIYCGGGAGYTINRPTLHQMIKRVFRSKRCFPDATRSDEDRTIGKCLRDMVVPKGCYHNLDELNQTRYHHYDAEFHATWRRGMGENWNYRELMEHHGINSYQERLDSISETSTTFHLVQPDKIFPDKGLRRYHALLRGLCQQK
mmetsp:Transcript_27872/g.41133  ORF Transcript_27872/g.41133 Transcript_27872/m.41133 type:complete len:178 (-) Transcript_27872:2689-3222(-)